MAAVTELVRKTAPPACAFINPPGHNSPLPWHALPNHWTQAPDETKARNNPRVILPPFSVLSSLIPPRIPPGPHATLPLLGAESLQLSSATLGELDMKLYVSRVR